MASAETNPISTWRPGVGDEQAALLGKFNELLANCAIYSTTLDLTQAANALAAEGWHIDPDDLATISPYITTAIRRFGDWVLNLTPPAETTDGHLALAAASGQ